VTPATATYLVQIEVSSLKGSDVYAVGDRQLEVEHED
jgi:hypothetical protein